MFFSQGLDTLKVPRQLHADNRKKLLARFKTSEVPENAIILLKGGCSTPIDDSDIEYVFKQESNFQYLFGVKEPDCYGMLDMKGKATLFIPKMPESLQPILGRIMPPEHYAKMYELDECYHTCDIPSVIARVNPDLIYILSGTNSDSGIPLAQPHFEGMEKYRVDAGKLVADIYECRLIKTPGEIEVMRYAVKASAEAQKAVMRAVKPGMMEYQLEATFLHHMYFHYGCRTCGYTPICAAGERTAVLHYGHAGAPNDQPIKDGDMILMDCGTEYHCYDGDLTLSYPANGKFTDDQKEVYESVYAVLRGVEAAMKPGVLWPDMHRLADRIICTELKKRGFLQGDIEEMQKYHIGALFMPHGLGHLLGLDTHDVGGYPRGTSRINEPGICKLRSGRVLQPGMITTVEPGIYFNVFLLEPAYQDENKKKFLVWDKLQKFMKFGGIRLEDDVLITENGIEILDDVPRTIEEIENFMAGKPYKN